MAASILTGCVKWFDNGLNYGFITVLTEGVHYNTDIFVHQSNIQTKRECFRTLYTGECVQFTLTASDNAKHPYHAVAVSGFNGAMLHCENPNYRPVRVSNFRGNRGGQNNRDTFRSQKHFEKTTDATTVPESTSTLTEIATTLGDIDINTTTTNQPYEASQAQATRGRSGSRGGARGGGARRGRGGNKSSM